MNCRIKGMRRGCGPLLAIAVSLTAQLSGCALSDEGAIDYRRIAHTDRYVTGGDPEVQSAIQLVRKNTGHKDAETFKDGSSISVSLEQGLLADCVEWLKSPIRGFRKNCEIAIVARVVEFGNGQDFNFADEGVKAGRVVYYSSDVEPGQPFNLNHLPIYGPQTYHGGPLGIELYIIEIDAEDAQAQAVFQALAAIGGVAYPPAAPILKVLDRLGGALLSGTGGDDMEFRYFFTLDPRAGSSGFDSQLQPGGYALVREDTRTARTNWAQLALDENSGRIFELDSNGKVLTGEDGRPAEYRDNSYLTLSIDKDKSAKSVDLSQNTYGTFRAALDAADKKKAEQISTSARDVVDALVDRRATENYDRARGALAEIRSKKGRTGKASRADVLSSLKLIGEGIAEKEKWDKLKTDGKIEEAFDLKGGKVLTEPQINYLLGELRALAGANVDQVILDKLTIEQFNTLLPVEKEALVLAITG